MKRNVSLLTNLLVLASFSASLPSCQGSNNQIILYMSTEEEKITYIYDALKKKFPNYDIITQYTDTGTLLSKLQGEGKNTQCDIFYDLEGANAEILLANNPDLFADLSYLDFSIYDSSVMNPDRKDYRYACNVKDDCAIIVNKKVLSDNNLPIPTTYDDLLKPEYKGLIVMPNPKTSGTGYSFYNGVVSLRGEDEAMKYFKSLNDNIVEYTTSGSAPLKLIQRGEAGIGVAQLFEIVSFSNEDSNLQPVYLSEGLSYNIFNMGMINGHETREAVKNVFDYLFNELNPEMVPHFFGEKAYKNQAACAVANYPTDIKEIEMKNLFNPTKKNELLDKWIY